MAKKIKSYSEAELIKMFGLERLVGNEEHLLMQEWTNTSTQLNDWESGLFEDITKELQRKIAGWNEEMLKMNLIAFIIRLGHLVETKRYKTYYESLLEAKVGEYFLKTRTDMMIATGILEIPETPYFYFQEYKKVKDPKGDVTGQLLEAFLIAQELNKNGKPLYGCTVWGREWEFYVMTEKTYCVSKPYLCTEKDDLLQIIAILRKFKEILETRLLDKT
jgi:hypothetical protein